MSTNVEQASVEIGERLRSERQRLRLTQGQLATICHISKTSQVNYESGVRSPDVLYMQHLHTAGVDLSYVVTGVRANSTGMDDTFVSIPMLGVTASAGPGQVNESSAEYEVAGLAFSKAWISKRNLFPKNLRVIEVKGASMAGVLSDGDRVLIDISDTVPKSGFVYVIRQCDELLVKYCQLLPGGKLRVSSANTQFASYDVDLERTDDVAIVGRVVASMHEW